MKAVAQVAFLVLLLAACGGGSTPTSTPAPATATNSPAPTASATVPTAAPTNPAPPTATAALGPTPITPASATPSGTPSGLQNLPVFPDGSHSSLPAGTYVTTQPVGFLPGLQLTVPDGYSITESDSGELSIVPDDHPNNSLMLWKDAHAVTSTNGTSPAGTVLTDVGFTPKAISAWMAANPDFHVISGPTATTTTAGLQGPQLTLTTSDTANFGDPDCPANPKCAAVLKDERHWGEDFFAIGGDDTVQIFMTTVGPNRDHTLFAVLYAPTADELNAFAPEVQPIIDSLVLPATYFDN